MKLQINFFVFQKTKVTEIYKTTCNEFLFQIEVNAPIFTLIDNAIENFKLLLKAVILKCSMRKLC